MRRVPFIILASVVLFLSVVVGVMLARSRAPKPEPSEPSASKADYRIKEVHLQEEGRDGSRWRLDAEYGESFEEQGKTVMKKVVIRVEEPKRAWTVTGDEGDLASDSKDVELRGNVVVVSSDGLRIETTRLWWDAEEQRAWTDEPVTIYRSGAVVLGRGFEARVAEEATTVKGRVRATFSRDLRRRQPAGERS
jgi:LPS export ABC transporter protein LptC